MQRFVDNVLAVTKESVKTVTYESLSNIARFINWVSGLMLTFLPGKANILEGVHGWELRPTFQGPKFPRWMENGVSSFNQFIHELSVDSDTSSLDYSSGEDLDGSCPPTPTSQCSQSSRENSHSKLDRHQTHWLAYIFSRIILPIKLLLGIPCCLWDIIFTVAMGSRTPSVPESPRPSQSRSFRKRYSLKDHFVHRTTDRRRGIIEDLHVGIEIIIEAIFDIFHKVAHFILSPSEAFEFLFSLFSSPVATVGDGHEDVSDAPLTTQTLGDDVPAPQERNVSIYHPLNTDARTCQDVITELGYPYEAIRVITSDGYVLLLERIPRRDSRKAVYLQHGILDSSMGWVSNGIVGSPAFAAFNQGYDVFLGNLRGLVSREHVDKKISSRKYWRYSINEHGTEDIPAMIEKIHEIKTAELGLNHPDEEINDEQQPYKLSAICHSLGGAAMLMHVVTRRIEKKPHRLSRLVLLSPAGFHDDSNPFFLLVEYLFLLLAPIISLLVPAFYIPTRFFRMLLNKLARDFHNYPAVGGLVQTLMSYVVGGDSSNWVGVLGLPHYNMDDMPGVSFRVAHHLAQIKHARRFRMYDYGSASANMRIYGFKEPFDIGENYGLIDIPVDLVAGSKDKVIRPSMVRKHYRLMKDAGVEVSYNEFEYAHLDFTFSHHEELLAYVMSRLLIEDPAAPRQPERQPSLGTIRSRKKVQPDS